ncbi:phosphatase PAP2 family protein [Streptomyces montanus]|uniref:Phosphatase PAP2 family protein n=1 Tax=Streptomyces montanus TaxID=2580423 RepID=A0A5R9FQ34_9ACTN|nr:phosphatase PAP2 family protein [Streptomyces montanus]TLS41625.1 phosphatase PAP2 family protein [Streptomyces montanus]
MGDTRSGPPQPHPGRAIAHTTGASGFRSPHRSDSRPPQTPRGVRRPGLDGRLGTSPPVPGRPTLFLGGLALLFAFLTWQAAVDTPLRRADERLGRAITGSRLPGGAAEFLADLGNFIVAVPVLVAVLAYVAWRARRAGTPRWWLPPLAALVALAAVPALIAPLKAVVGRAGPPGMEGDGFYPSGHTATAAVAYGAAVLLLLPWLRDTYVRRELTIACVVLVVAVGFGLIRRGYHWPLDVAGSLVLSAMLLITLTVFLHRVGRTGGRRQGGS